MSDKTRYWFDTEFMEDGEVIELLAIAVVCEDGREFYAEAASADFSHANEWVRENVIPQLAGGTTRKSRAEIAGELLKFVNHGAHKPEFWAYYGDYDWVVLCQLYGTMMDLPKGWPMFAMDVKQLCVSLGDPRLPKQTIGEHDALEDARWTRGIWTWLTNHIAPEAERDAYRNTLLDVAHLEDSPAAGANIAARTLNEWRGDRDPVVAGPWPSVGGTALIRLICSNLHRWWGHARGNLESGDPCPECRETLAVEGRGPMTYAEGRGEIGP